MNEKKLIYCKHTLQQVYRMNQPKYLCFPTNTYILPNGLCYLFGKCYQVVKNDYKEILKDYAEIIKNGNTSVNIIKTVKSNILLSFPTRHHWKYSTDPKLVKRSCCQLYNLQRNHQLLDNLKIYLPLQVDGYVDFNLQDLVDYVGQYLIRIDNLEIILI